MAIKIVRKEGDPVLRQIAKPVPEVTSNIQKLLTDMAETMYENQGIGLAANQIGILKRCIVADVGEGGPGLIQLVNPEVVHAEGEQLGAEGCLSIPGVTGDVLRAARVTVKGLNRDGREVEIQAAGLLARCLLHEIDHLNGVLFTDHVRRMGGGTNSKLPRR